jgi:hypothetical protein
MTFLLHSDTVGRKADPQASKFGLPGNWFADSVRRERLIQCLTFGSGDDTPILRMSIENVCKFRVTPFEVIAGTPRQRYGARITFQAAGGGTELATAFGLADHPWGDPDWVGVRVGCGSGPKVKAYHRLTNASRFRLPPGLPAPLYPVMAALHEGAVEVYLRFGGCCSWTEFVQRCCGALGETKLSFSPHPRPVENAFCLSLRWQGEQLASVSVFADYRALPDDETIEKRWSEGMTEQDRAAYEIALAGVRSLGRRPFGPWHAMLAWTLESDGSWHRAASLYLP